MRYDQSRNKTKPLVVAESSKPQEVARKGNKMSEINKLNDEVLEEVTGGASRRVSNDAASYANLRTAPGLDSDVKMKLKNGTWVETTGKKRTKDGYTWYQVYVPDSEDLFGWIAGSLIGY